MLARNQLAGRGNCSANGYAAQREHMCTWVHVRNHGMASGGSCSGALRLPSLKKRVDIVLPFLGRPPAFREIDPAIVHLSDRRYDALGAVAYAAEFVIEQPSAAATIADRTSIPAALEREFKPSDTAPGGNGGYRRYLKTLRKQRFARSGKG
jgi:hypothetical protein